MKRICLPKWSSVLLLCISAPLCSANIVLNGGFEDPNIGVTAFVHHAHGSTGITNWIVEAPSPTLGVDLISTRTGCTGCAHTGEQSIDMAGTPGRGSIYQDLTTIVGQSYLLSFWVSSNVGPFTGGMDVEFGSTSLGSVNSPSFGTWTQISFNVVATSTSTRLKFIGNLDGTRGVFLDDVEVDAAVGAVPEPATWTFVLAAGVLGAFLRNKRKTEPARAMV